MKKIASLILLGLSLSASSTELVEHSCGLLYNQADVDGVQYLKTDDLRVLDYNEEVEFHGFQLPEGMTVSGVMCNRSSTIPSKYDYVILKAGYTLTLNSKKQMAVLEISGGKYRFRKIDGEDFTKEERKQIDERLEFFQSKNGENSNQKSPNKKMKNDAA
jgi:hypothetical protein